jgi:heme-degrading monooxygenase HmoA
MQAGPPRTFEASIDILTAAQSERPMLLREWRGRASASKADAYPVHFRTKVLPELARVPGCLGAELGERQIDDTIEFLVLTRWRDIGAIQSFTEREIDKAIVEPGAIAAPIDFDASVRHYEVIEDV